MSSWPEVVAFYRGPCGSRDQKQPIRDSRGTWHHVTTNNQSETAATLGSRDQKQPIRKGFNTSPYTCIHLAPRDQTQPIRDSRGTARKRVTKNVGHY
ncbi:hypothetical protein AVEN_245742-1 [Araneus ventricosus]|uniref:Uncharacterized protein n=1 Tax=Araneus ventricosus TaxID=182803 RepID=A0A4Y2JKU0_ARAVE|nr:hypothetical protein AVEN_245742-1 [Araneus ventricosus]